MAELSNWAFPSALQPNAKEVGFDLHASLDAVVKVRAEVPEDAFTAETLGVERSGNGVVIREDGLVLTIGYLITEAQTIWLTTNAGMAVPGHPLAYDQSSGFGLILPLGTLGVAPLARGSTDSIAIGDNVIVSGHGGRAHSLKAKVLAKREFAGYWEYLLDEAIFTTPAHPQWGGAALIGDGGELLGIGSLLVQEASKGETVEGNMIVPIDLLEPILEDMLTLGRAGGPPRPWLGMYVTEVEGHLVVGGLAKGGPAERAGVQIGDLVMEIADVRVTKLADMLRSVWSLGPAGTDVPVSLSRDGGAVRVRLRSVDRNALLRKPKLH
jgi:S1-C subfamily serine protease